MNDEELIAKGDLMQKTIDWWSKEVRRLAKAFDEEVAKPESEARNEKIEELKSQLTVFYAKGKKEVIALESFIDEIEGN